MPELPVDGLPLGLQSRLLVSVALSQGSDHVVGCRSEEASAKGSANARERRTKPDHAPQ